MRKVREVKTRYLICILVENRPGVLARVADLFSARGYNIDSLSVAETLDPSVSRITCTTGGSAEVVEQVVKQLRKLIDVLRVLHFPLGSQGFVSREMLLVKVNAREQQRAEIMRIAEIFRAKVVDISKSNITLEVTGDPEKIQAILQLFQPMGVSEIARTGLVALSRGAARLQNGLPPGEPVREMDAPGEGVGEDGPWVQPQPAGGEVVARPQ